MPLTGNWYKFGDLDDQLVCRGGSQVCNNRWNIQDVAAVCCSAEGADQSVCYDLWYVLSTTNTRVHDICCDGLQTCYNFDFLNVNSLSCRGQDTCYNGDADIASNLYCDGQSLVNNAEAKNACYQFGIIFGQLQASNHCITCKGDETCRSSDWKFPNGGNVQMSCSNLPAAGNLNCYDLNLFFDADACIYLDCNDGLSSPQGNPCSQLAVLAKKSPAANVDCTCVGNCGGLRTTSPDTAYKVVNCSTDGTGSTCGITCGIDDTACCKGDPTKAANGGHPRCGTGFCTTSTSSTTTTTSESGQDPSSGTTTSTTTTTTTSTAQGAGDPHIDTFDGQHYLLLKQGSFSFWRFSGSLSWCQGTKVSQRTNDPLVELNCDESCNQVYITIIYNNHVLVRVKVGRSTTSLQSEVPMLKSSQLPGSNCCAKFLEPLEIPRCSSNEAVLESIPCLDGP